MAAGSPSSRHGWANTMHCSFAAIMPASVNGIKRTTGLPRLGAGHSAAGRQPQGCLSAVSPPTGVGPPTASSLIYPGSIPSRSSGISALVATKAVAAKQAITDLGNMAPPPSRRFTWKNGPSFAVVNRTRRLLYRPRQERAGAGLRLTHFILVAADCSESELFSSDFARIKAQLIINIVGIFPRRAACVARPNREEIHVA